MVVRFLGASIAILLFSEYSDATFIHYVNSLSLSVSNESSLCEQLAQTSCDESNFKQQCPKLLFLGTEHGGTTTLSALLEQHPDVSFGRRKEHRFFVKKGVTSYVRGGIDGRRFNVDQNHLDTVQEYVDSFRVPCNTKVTFDGSPQTVFLGGRHLKEYGEGARMLHHPGIENVRYVRDVLGPDLKMVMTIRDPVDWIMSVMERKFTSLSANERALEVSCFADSLEPWLQVFPKNNFLFVCAEDLFQKQAAVAQRMFDFIGLQAPNRTESGELAEVSSGRRRNTNAVSQRERAKFHASKRAKQCREKLVRLTGVQCSWKGVN
eukprot:TRINITY_DN37522_c0_g1_i1.p1 TRINITY_DN37522_c0_g1~~TRINITY_DN37522_c0_g1_i1.p1  ORF type:complete len:337 (-),score=46.88 TRINITY_DN37522_c0_g1_i1:57-1019(-)